MAADSVLRTGDKDIRARMISIEYLNVFTPVNHLGRIRTKEEKENGYTDGQSGHLLYYFSSRCNEGPPRQSNQAGSIPRIRK